MPNAVIIGAGPCGLAAAAACQREGIDAVVLDKGCIVQSIYNYPTFMIFHSTPELLEIGGIPFHTPNEKPTRLEGLVYYRTVVDRLGLRVRQYEAVVSVQREGAGFVVTSEDRFGKRNRYEADYVVMATGYFGQPNKLGVPGEELPKIAYYYKEAHPYSGRKVAVVGGRNSAVDASLDLVRAGAEVTMIYRRHELTSSVKAWTRPLFESMVNKGRIRVMWNSHVEEILPYSLKVRQGEDAVEIDNDEVLVLTGFRPDRSFFGSVGIAMDPETGAPQHDPETMETNVEGVFIAGVVTAGSQANAIFIENGRHHGDLIAQAIKKKGGQ